MSIKDDKTIEALKKAYGFTVFDLMVTQIQKNQIVTSARNSSKYFKDIAKNLNLNIVKLFTNSEDNSTVAIFSYTNDETRLFAIKGSFTKNGFSFSNDLFVEKKDEDKGITEFIIGKDNEVLTLVFSKNNEKIYNINLGSISPNLLNLSTQLKSDKILALNSNSVSVANFDDRYGNHGGNGFCQRERGENFSDCYKAEKDEFCDGFFSCLAVDTQPQVMLLIAASCACAASQSD